jgi:hypothetical protein
MKLDADSHPSEYGRQGTIYATTADIVNWNLNLPPGQPNPVCWAVNGSNYFGYRNDLDEQGGYISCREVFMNNDISQENKYNPGHYEDPFLTLSVEVENQLERQNIDGDDEHCCCRFQ